MAATRRSSPDSAAAPATLYHHVRPEHADQLAAQGLQPEPDLTVLDRHFQPGVYLTRRSDPAASDRPFGGAVLAVDVRGLELLPVADAPDTWRHPGPIEPARLRRIH